MFRKSLPFALLALTAFAVVQARASTVAVTNYNWLQLPLNMVTASIGGGAGGGSGFGSPLDFRVGDPEWIPNNALTNNGAGTYFAQVTFDQPRDVKSVTNEWYGAQGGIRRYTLQGSTDGVSFVDIGFHDYGPLQIGSNILTTVTVTEGTYKAVRAVLNADDYTIGALPDVRGGPGLMGFDVKGDGFVDSSQVNWANQPTFGTVASNSGMDFNSTGYTSGNLYDDDNIRTGMNPGPWNGSFAQIDLTTLRAPQQIVLVWDTLHNASSVTFLYSTDNITYKTLPQLGAQTNFGTQGGYDVYNVLQRDMRYLRITNAAGLNSFHLLNQVLVFGVPEPATVSLIAVGALPLLRRRR